MYLGVGSLGVLSTLAAVRVFQGKSAAFLETLTELPDKAKATVQGWLQ